jgi:hypothetical protein
MLCNEELDMTDLVFGWLAVLTIACAFLIAFATGKLAAPFTHGKATAMTARVLLALAVWLLLTAVLAKTGSLSAWDARPPHFPFVPLLALVAIVAIHRSTLFARILAVTPPHWLVAMQTFRIGVELAFWGLFVAGGAPSQVTFEGRNFDVLVGLTAPFVAFAIARVKLGPRAVIAWNVLGLAILGNTIFTTITSLPGPAHLDWSGGTFTAFGDWPFVWIPAFLAPLAIFLHTASIRQSLGALRPGKSVHVKA